MAYNIIDLLNKAISVSIRKREIYENIKRKEYNVPSMEIIPKILIKKIDNTIEYYEALKKEIGNESFEEIDIRIYDRISFLINEFSKKIYEPEINNVREFLEFSLGLEKDTYSLIIDIQGRFTENTSDVHTKTYKILSAMISNKADFVATLEKILK
ncbi:hypothetical protein JOC70_003059 [Clostridium pascui]|uniref:hypothetical protein n=1 Tax=Clostridium pascui TaxID=46609 RepID=UPI00195C4E32|nr:hypothetical protein [Clostridium pascui]MBM7871559.1 hypothetical protein [Clostridium pascui]